MSRRIERVIVDECIGPATASCGLSPAACRRRRTDQATRMIASKGGASEPADTLLLGKAGGAAAVRRTLASTICRAIGPMLVARPRQLRDASTVMRFQPAHQSMINRRHDGRASWPAQRSPKHPLERKPRIYLPATCKGGHESGSDLARGTRSGCRLGVDCRPSPRASQTIRLRRFRSLARPRPNREVRPEAGFWRDRSAQAGKGSFGESAEASAYRADHQFALRLERIPRIS